MACDFELVACLGLELLADLHSQSCIVLANDFFPSINVDLMRVIPQKTDLDKRESLVDNQFSPVTVQDVPVGILAVKALKLESCLAQQHRQADLVIFHNTAFIFPGMNIIPECPEGLAFHDRLFEHQKW